MNFGKTFLACLLAIIVGSAISFIVSMVLFIGTISSLALFSEQKTRIESGSILVIDLSDPIVETTSAFSMSAFDWNSMSVSNPITLYNAVAMIDAAASDPRIKGIYIKSEPQTAPSLEHLYELRMALQRFRATSGGKFVLAYGDMYSQGALYLASVADQLYVNPAGGLEWSGLSMGTIFYKGALDKLGVEAQVVRYGEFKSAVEPLFRTDMSPENRAQYTALSSSVWKHMTSEIAASRHLTIDSLNAWASNLSVVTARNAARLGLVDSVMYRDAMIEKLCELTDADKEDDLKLIGLHHYRRSGVNLHGDVTSNNQVAVVYASGTILDSGIAPDAIVGNNLARKLRSIREDEKVKAVVLRVNSPGGSALASEVIRHEVERLRAEKPVVVSMGDYAASGGYWISASADKIIAAPMTLTGSIGVFGVIFNAGDGLREKLGVTYDVVRTNPSADMGSLFRPLSKVERMMIQRSVDTIYTNFVSVVASGRKMNFDSVNAIGGGRVWSGTQGVDNGLVNSLGGLNDAILDAAEMAGIDSYAVVRVGDHSNSPFAQFLSEFSGAVWTKITGGQTIIDQTARQIERLASYHRQVMATMEDQPVWNN